MCPFSGGADAGYCMDTSGVLSNAEIRRVLDRTGVEPTLDREAGIKYISWEGQWLKLRQRRWRYWRSPWGIFKDLSVNAALRVDRDLKSQNEAVAWAGSGKDVEECMFNRGRRDPTNQRAGRGKRTLCVPGNIEAEGCSWVGEPLFCSPPLVFSPILPIAGLIAAGGCPQGSIHLANDNMPPSSDDNDAPKECFPESKLDKRWCDEFDFGSMRIGGDLAGGLVIRGVVEKILRRSSNLGSAMDPTLTGMFDGYNGCNDLRYGDIEDLIRLGYTPYNLPAGSDFKWPDLDDDDGECTTTITTSKTVTESIITVRECDVKKWPQACHNYVSVAKHWLANGHNSAGHSDHLLCPWEWLRGATATRSVPRTWNGEHSGWTNWLPKPGGTTCERDEYLFIRFIGPPNPPIQFLRVLPKSENGRAGVALVQGVCPTTLESQTTVEMTSGGSRTCYVNSKTTKTQVVLSISYPNWDDDWENTAIWDDHLRQNPCIPNVRFDDPGFVLLTDDPWYKTGSGKKIDSAVYRDPPPFAVTQGLTLPRRVLDDKDIFFSDENGFGIVDERNQSRRATPEELRKHLGILPCLSPNCVEEKAALGLDVNGNPTPISLQATTTAVDPMKEATGSYGGNLPDVAWRSIKVPRLPTVTPAP
ncbi:hypothetical protein EsH8_V_001167 [Colletotrichum jinshuiense]